MESGEDFAGSFYSNLRSIVTLTDNLRDAGLQKYIRLPRIVTLGIQSSGKSSVLESIVGLNFLPRSEGICTRCPLELRLVHTENETKPWAEFEGVQEKFTDFGKVKEMILAQTDKKAGRNKGIVDDPIILTIHSSTCPDLTLIDLPGITRIPLAGSDHPADIERITKEMCFRYISDPRTIILCLCPANTDLSTSESLLMAKKVDKAGIRTIGVITKIDIMDRGTNAKKILLGEEIPLRLGYVGVKNRSQEDINNEVKVENALQEEKQYFASHPVYSTMPQGVLGTEVLTQKLTHVMFNHIKGFLPEIMRETMFRIKECDDKLKELGPSTPEEPRYKVQLLWNMVTDFCEIFKNTIRGKYDRKLSSRITKDLAGGATIKSYFNSLLSEFSSNTYKVTESYTNEDIQHAMASHEGDTIPGFPSVDVFIFLLQPQLEKLREPVLDCLMNVHSYLDQLASKLIERIFYRFPALSTEIAELASHVLVKEREECREIVEKMIDSEETYVFTNDLDYLTSRTDIVPKSDGRPKSSEVMFVDEIRNRIDCYFRLVIRTVRDSVPKAIGTFLVRSVMDKMQMELYERINMTETILAKVSEPPHITAERNMLKGQLETLRKAEKIMKHDPALAMQAESVEDEIRKQEEELKAAAEEKKKRDEEKKKREEDKERDKARKEELDNQERNRKATETSQIIEDVKQPEPPRVEPKQATSNSLFGDIKKAKRTEKSLF
ncbi:unnamed protein product [Blepharisma stoltei]|uniref:Uncharacterized protein n=1 Tax=Blepharisma stoltei TaxID=1481888 RepID=A0AAU9JFR8_9CILI|nr:unnamed protein product [Blepharisma stoltei]